MYGDILARETALAIAYDNEGMTILYALIDGAKAMGPHTPYGQQLINMYKQIADLRWPELPEDKRYERVAGLLR